MSGPEVLYRGTSLQRLMRNLGEGCLRNNPPEEPDYDSGEIPPLRTNNLYTTTSPTRAAYFARTIEEETRPEEFDEPILLELEKGENHSESREWSSTGITDYKATEILSENIETVYQVPEDSGEQMPSDEKVKPVEHESWVFDEYLAFNEMFRRDLSL